MTSIYRSFFVLIVLAVTFTACDTVNPLELAPETATLTHTAPRGNVQAGCVGASPFGTCHVPFGTLRLNRDLLVSTEWLARQLRNPNVVVVHVGTLANYNAGHIPGARFVALGPLQPTQNGIQLMLADAAVLRNAFEAAGVSDHNHVVVYGDGPLQGARGFFMLDYLGLRRVSLLDGGKAAWVAEGRLLATEGTPPAPGRITTSVNAERLVTADWVYERLHDDGVSLIDARPLGSYVGTTANPSVPPDRQGHIPGAHNLPWQQLINSSTDPRLKDVASLRSLFETAGATPRSEVVTYCYSGMMSSLAYFAARYLGYDAKLYDGSYFEWSVNRDLPVAACATPWCD
jgi:thiosulfate/3-mercaptopyruvate sulfurtransferase